MASKKPTKKLNKGKKIQPTKPLTVRKITWSGSDGDAYFGCPVTRCVK